MTEMRVKTVYLVVVIIIMQNLNEFKWNLTDYIASIFTRFPFFLFDPLYSFSSCLVPLLTGLHQSSQNGISFKGTWHSDDKCTDMDLSFTHQERKQQSSQFLNMLVKKAHDRVVIQFFYNSKCTLLKQVWCGPSHPSAQMFWISVISKQCFL